MSLAMNTNTRLITALLAALPMLATAAAPDAG